MSASSAQITSIKYRFIQVNGIKMHIAEQGKGPLIVLARGWAELWRCGWATWYHSSNRDVSFSSDLNVSGAKRDQGRGA
jgi:hypothetical protein